MNAQKVIIIMVILICVYLLYHTFINKPNKPIIIEATSKQNNEIITFNKDIRYLFTKKDIDSMKWKFDLSKYEDVKNYANQIYSVVETGRMPCYAPWSKDKVKLFKKWIKQGKQL